MSDVRAGVAHGIRTLRSVPFARRGGDRRLRRRQPASTRVVRWLSTKAAGDVASGIAPPRLDQPRVTARRDRGTLSR